MSGDDCLPVCLVVRSVNNMTVVPALRCVKRQIVNTFFTLMSVDTRRNAGVEKYSTPASAASNVCSVGPIRIVYFRVITRHCKIILAPARTFVAMDGEKLRQYALSHPF